MTDEQAVLRCQDGEREAFRHLVERYQDVLYGTAVLMTGDRAQAEEHVQEAFLAAWRGMPGFHSERPVKPWLMRILVNTVMSQRRRRVVSTVSLEYESEAEDAARPAEEIEAQHDRLVIRQALAGLNPEQRQVVVLRFFAGLTVPQLAEAIGVREGTVKSRLHRALGQLRDQLTTGDAREAYGDGQ
ncbi:MAG: sigma-70 family RNA polymerase sigma factor [Chloroflexi bacterium]|nr:sigma-70 family RNA polymerase sigma factor [Chloroflexota bacterium]